MNPELLPREAWFTGSTSLFLKSTAGKTSCFNSTGVSLKKFRDQTRNGDHVVRLFAFIVGFLSTIGQMASLKWSVICFLLLFVISVESAGKIHRAMSPSTRSKTKNAINVSRDEAGRMSSASSCQVTPWLYAIPATLLVGLTGIFPLLVIPVEAGHKLREGVSANRLKLLLSFAVGGLLGDVFLHLLPEAFGPVKEETAHEEHLKIGLWLIGGLLTFLVLEKVFQESDNNESDKKTDYETKNVTEASKETKSHHSEQNGHACNGSGILHNGYIAQNGFSDLKKRTKESKPESIKEIKDCSHSKTHFESDNEKEDVKVIGYLNLLANCIDNFTHGLAVSGSFLVSTKVGLLTTFAILLHEIPHEIGDFAILLKSGFRRWDAACGQIVTASGGLAGAVFGLVVTEPGDSTYWVLPFTSGGFIYIALVTIVPELLEENQPRESFKQLLCLTAGITAMGLVSLIHSDEKMVLQNKEVM